MKSEHITTIGENPTEVAGSGQGGRGKGKKSKKVRSAWVAFGGRIVAQTVGALATVVLGIALVQHYPARPAPSAESSRVARARSSRPAIAVLPLDNFSGDAKHDHVADGLTESLTAGLAEARDFDVVSRTSAMRFRDDGRRLPEIARDLNVDFVVEGSIVQDGARLHVTAQLIDAATDEHLWARSFETSTPPLEAQAELARQIAGALSGLDVRGVRQ